MMTRQILRRRDSDIVSRETYPSHRLGYRLFRPLQFSLCLSVLALPYSRYTKDVQLQ